MGYTNLVSLLLLLLIFTLAGGAQNSPQSIVLTVSTKLSVVGPASKIRLQIVETNKSDHDILHTLAMPTAEDQEPHSELAGLQVEVRDSTGETPTLKRWGRVALKKELPSDPITITGPTALAFPLHPGELASGGITGKKFVRP